MEILRRNFFKQAVSGAAALSILKGEGLGLKGEGLGLKGGGLGAARVEAKSWDSKLMGNPRFVDVDGVRTRYFEGGTGEALLLVHGSQFGGSASADGWRPIFDPLARHFHVYAFDKLGMGVTDNPKNDADYSMDAVIRHAYRFLEKVGISKAVLVGHSRGALPVARIAIDHPERVSHLVILDSNTLAPDDPNTPERNDPPLVDTPPTKEEVRQSEMSSRSSVRKEFLTDTYIEAAFRIAQLPKLREAEKQFREARDKWIRENPEKFKQNPAMGRNMGATTWWMYKAKYETLDLIKAGKLKTPTLIVWGLNDPTAPYFLGVNLLETLSKVVPRVELHVISQCGHFIAAEHPEEVTTLIAGFVKG
jgi:2-hydroxy-6-oxo-6-(2'-carboxyphenyl)-hexa-2,4-dienoate hydrolase